MTQHQLVIRYIQKNGSIIPSKNVGREYWEDKIRLGFFGAELPRRCRELRKDGTLSSIREGKFEKFFINQGQANLF